ncbi:DUF3343 domain-containing protein [Clostridium oceanicum]|uniref:Putative Se/S carrier protein-like domain-containing protein n=1 Tax=Clostridium oceanicum TaxID=1543 RepID=A0ABN1JAK6_9CLOT
MEYISIFFTHSGAIKYSRFLKKQNIKNKTLPVPRKLSSNCGIGVKFFYDKDVSEIITEDIEKIFKMSDKEYCCIYRNE